LGAARIDTPAERHPATTQQLATRLPEEIPIFKVARRVPDLTLLPVFITPGAQAFSGRILSVQQQGAARRL